MVEKQVNLRLEENLLNKIDTLVKAGMFKTKTEAFKKALEMLIDRYYKKLLEEKLEKIREGTSEFPSLTNIVVKIHEEEET